MNFFGFGTLSSQEAMEAITGKKLTGHLETIKGYKLVVQELKDIPKGAQDILTKVWGSGFESYAMVPAEDSEVKGMVWEGLNEKDMEILNNWELTFFKWFKEHRVDNDLSTFVLCEGQNIYREVDGLNYDPFLNKGEGFKEKFIGIATLDRNERQC